MKDWVRDAKSKSRKWVASPTSGREFLIRKLTNSELTEAGLPALIAVTAEPANVEDRLFAAAHRIDQTMIVQTKYALEHAVLEPVISYGEENTVPEGSVHASWISEDERWLFLSILDFSGIANADAKKELQAYVKNAPGSEPSTKSAEDTGSSLTSSSATT